MRSSSYDTIRLNEQLKNREIMSFAKQVYQEKKNIKTDTKRAPIKKATDATHVTPPSFMM